MHKRLSVYLPLKIQSVANLREHWAEKHRRVKSERQAVALVLRSAAKGLALPLPCRVTMTRVAFTELDSDNLVSAFKAVRDQIADELHVNDHDPRVEWVVAWEKCKRGDFGCRIVIEAV